MDIADRWTDALQKAGGKITDSSRVHSYVGGYMFELSFELEDKHGRLAALFNQVIYENEEASVVWSPHDYVLELHKR